MDGAERLPLIRVTAPASAANIGPGFDCVGAALTCSLTVTVRDGEPDPGSLVSRAAERVLGEVPGCAFEIESAIPIGRGLGSSAAVVAAGMLAACALKSREPDPEELLSAGVVLEGHPDNLAAALFGGVTLASGSSVVHFEPAASVRPLILVPREQLLTAEARRVLPDDVPRQDAVDNIGRAAVLTALLSGVVEATPQLLLAATEDAIHQPYRMGLMPNTARTIATLRERGVAAAVSGAGPSVVCLVVRGEEDNVRQIAPDLDGWDLLDLDFDLEGARIIDR